MENISEPAFLRSIKYFFESPLWVQFLFSLFLFYACLELGLLLGKWYRNKKGERGSQSFDSIITANLSLLALMLAFTFATAANLFNERKELVVDEANAIGTAFLRADYLPSSHSLVIKNLLKDYVNARVSAIQKDEIEWLLKKSDEINSKIWDKTTSIFKSQPGSLPIALFVESINEVFDFHSKRVIIGLYSRIPMAMWMAIYLLAILGVLTLGFQTGYKNRKRSKLGITLLCSFAIVLYMIADLDQPGRGLIQESEQATFNLKNQLDWQ